MYFSSDYFNESVLSKFDYWSYSEHSGFVVVDMMKSGIDSNALKELSKYKQITQIKISEPPGVPIDEMEWQKEESRPWAAFLDFYIRMRKNRQIFLRYSHFYGIICI